MKICSWWVNTDGMRNDYSRKLIVPQYKITLCKFSGYLFFFRFTYTVDSESKSRVTHSLSFISVPHILLGRFPIQWKPILSNKFVTANNNNTPGNLKVLNVKVSTPTNNVTGSLNLGNMNQLAATVSFCHLKENHEMRYLVTQTITDGYKKATCYNKSQFYLIYPFNSCGKVQSPHPND